MRDRTISYGFTDCPSNSFRRRRRPPPPPAVHRPGKIYGTARTGNPAFPALNPTTGNLRVIPSDGARDRFLRQLRPLL